MNTMNQIFERLESRRMLSAEPLLDSLREATGDELSSAAAVALVRFSGLKDYLTAEGLGRFLASAGLWAPVVFIGIYAVGVCLFVPGSILTGIGAVIFGAYWGLCMCGSAP
jgi:hypothetical protein